MQPVLSSRSSRALGSRCFDAVEGALVTLAHARARPRAEARDELRKVRFLVAVRDYLLSEGRVRPQAMDDPEFILLRPLCEHLVRTGRFPQKRLELFPAVSHWQFGAPDRGTAIHQS
jgi:hypothetical protein